MHVSLGKRSGPPVVWSLSAHLIAFGLALIVPVLLLSGLLLWNNVRQEHERLAHRVGSLAQKLVDDVDREIATAVSTLEVLSLSPALTGRDFETFRAHANQIGRVLSMNIILLDQAGQPIMDTLAPAGTPPPPGALPEISHRTVAGGGIHVSDLFVDAVEKQPAFVVSVPIRTGDFTGHTLCASIDPAPMGKLFRTSDVPAGWSAGVYDRGGALVAGSVQNGTGAAATSGNLSPEQRSRFVDRRGVLRMDAAGVEVLAGYERSSVAGWLVLVKLPARTFDAIATRSLGPLALLATALLANSVLLALWFGRGIARPVEQRVLERTEELEKAKAQLQAEIRQREEAQVALSQTQKLEALGQLTGSVAHDFNNQLMAILGGLELLEKHVEEPRMLRHVKNARSAARRASQLTDQLLSFARRSDIEPRAVNLTGLIDELDEVLRHAAGPEIRRSVDIPAETWAVRADPDQLHATLLNLALNARDAMPEGGTLSISARNVATGTPRPEQLPPGDFVVIAMADTGCGMTGAVLRQATDPFFTTKPRGKGTGLGLAIAQSFAEQSHGLLHITSTPGEGTTIEVFLPSEGLLREPQAAGTPAMPGSADGELVVLCVDDTRQSAEVTADLLRDVGFNAICTTDPEAALGFARSNERLDLLVTDIDMPGLDGFGLAEQLRACFPGLAVLFITGHDEHVFVPRLQNGRLPLPHFLRKPFSGTELAAKIAQMRITVILQPRARRDLEHAG